VRILNRLVERLKELDRDRESGAAMVEFVIVFPVQLVLTLMIMQFGLLCHAHVVVQQAAFMGARAAAVSDGMVDDGAAPQAAAERIAARTLIPLTSSDGSVRGGASTNVPGGAVNGTISWAQGPTLNTYRQEQAYAHMKVQVSHSQHIVQCAVEYDFVLIIPVAANILSRKVFDGFPFMNAGARNDASTLRGLPCVRVQRVGYVTTPWSEGGLTGNTTSVSFDDPGNQEQN